MKNIINDYEELFLFKILINKLDLLVLISGSEERIFVIL